MFWIFGCNHRRTREKPPKDKNGMREQPPIVSCVSCNASQPGQYYGERMWFSLFFVPILPMSRKRTYLGCSCCKYRAIHLDPPPTVTCEVCSARLPIGEQMPRFCQHCGAPLM